MLSLAVFLREKYTLEQEIRETEEAIRHKTTEVQVRTLHTFCTQIGLTLM